MADTHASRGQQSYKSSIKGPKGGGSVASAAMPPKKALNPSGQKQGTSKGR